MHVPLLSDTGITHVNVEQHVYTQMLGFTVFKHNFSHSLIINYGHILYKIFPGPFNYVYHQDY